MFPQELINGIPVPADLPADIAIGVDRTEEFSHDDVGLFLRGKGRMENYCHLSMRSWRRAGSTRRTNRH
jgi:hypothetical protein